MWGKKVQVEKKVKICVVLPQKEVEGCCKEIDLFQHLYLNLYQNNFWQLELVENELGCLGSSQKSPLTIVSKQEQDER